MSLKVGQKQAYVNNPIARLGAVRPSSYVQNRGALQKYNALDRGYGQSPRVEDDANASELLGANKLREICIA